MLKTIASWEISIIDLLAFIMQIMLAGLSVVKARSLVAVIVRKTGAIAVTIIKGNYIETLSLYFHLYFLAVA